MSYAIDFHFAACPEPVAGWLAAIDRTLADAGFRRMALGYTLYIDDSGEVDADPTPRPTSSIQDIETLFAANYGVQLTYSRADYTLALFLWRNELLEVVAAIDHREWEHLEAEGERARRVGGPLCAIAACIGSPFGWSKVNSEYKPQDQFVLDQLITALHERAREPALAWVTDEIATAIELESLLDGERRVIPTLSGYRLVERAAMGR